MFESKIKQNDAHVFSVLFVKFVLSLNYRFFLCIFVVAEHYQNAVQLINKKNRAMNDMRRKNKKLVVIYCI